MNKLKYIILSLFAIAVVAFTACENDSTDDSVDVEVDVEDSDSSDDADDSDSTLQSLEFTMPPDAEYYSGLMEAIPDGESGYLQLFLIGKSDSSKVVIKVEVTHENEELKVSMVDDFGYTFSVQSYMCMLVALTTLDGDLIEWHSDLYDSSTFATRGMCLTTTTTAMTNVTFSLPVVDDSGYTSGNGTIDHPYQLAISQI